jgi:hypothetical protein
MTYEQDMLYNKINNCVIDFSLESNHSNNNNHSSTVSDTITRNESQFGAVLEKHVAGRLLWVDPDAVLRDDGRGCRWDLELFGRELKNGSEGRVLGHAEDLKG